MSPPLQRLRISLRKHSYSLLVTYIYTHVGASDAERLEAAMDKLSVNFGVEILKIVPGYVSTEVDARLSYDAEATVAKARNIISLYESAGEFSPY